MGLASTNVYRNTRFFGGSNRENLATQDKGTKSFQVHTLSEIAPAELVVAATLSHYNVYINRGGGNR